MATPAASAFSIPRFLLPQNGAIWRRVNRLQPGAARQLVVRYASNDAAKGSKPIVLEKPAKFNPPSHGSRLPKRTTPRHYGGALSAEETQAQKKKDYPGTMPADGTWANWFWTSRNFHLCITLGTLTSLAVFTFVQNFRHTSPFAEMLPAGSEYLSHPIDSFGQLIEVIRLTENYQSEITAEKRKRKVDDVAKRNAYRQAHGITNDGMFASWTSKSDEESLGPAVPPEEEAARVAAEDAKPKKWFGLF